MTNSSEIQPWAVEAVSPHMKPLDNHLFEGGLERLDLQPFIQNRRKQK
jgi:hypothetical protein